MIFHGVVDGVEVSDGGVEITLVVFDSAEDRCENVGIGISPLLDNCFGESAKRFFVAAHGMLSNVGGQALNFPIGFFEEQKQKFFFLHPKNRTHARSVESIVSFPVQFVC